MTWFWLACLAMFSVGLVWSYVDRDRRHQNCRRYLRWRERPCHCCIERYESELGMRCHHHRIISVDTLGTLENPDRVAFLCMDCEAGLPHDFASPAH